MSKYKVKTLVTDASTLSDIEYFDRLIEDHINDGYEPIGGIRSIGDCQYYGTHLITLKKIIPEEDEIVITNCAICALRKTCGVNEFKKEFKSGTVISCGDFVSETNFMKVVVGETNE